MIKILQVVFFSHWPKLVASRSKVVLIKSHLNKSSKQIKNFKGILFGNTLLFSSNSLAENEMRRLIPL